MPSVSMDMLETGKLYTAHDLAEIWEYESFHAIGRGIVTPKNTNIIILFVTLHKAADRTQYADKLEGNTLYMEGQQKHKTDSRIANNLNNPKDEFHLFYREKRGDSFCYYGQCFLMNAVLKQSVPSEFIFSLTCDLGSTDDESTVLDYLAAKADQTAAEVGGALEGNPILSSHIRYERNPKNRKLAIAYHGTKCMVCGFDFDAVYGKEYAQSFIEIHHVKPIHLGVQEPDPKNDLIPVCANCHRMLHHRKYNAITVDELRKIEGVQMLKTVFG